MCGLWVISWFVQLMRLTHWLNTFTLTPVDWWWCWPTVCAGQLSLLPSVKREVTSSVWAVGWRPSVAGWGGIYWHIGIYIGIYIASRRVVVVVVVDDEPVRQLPIWGDKDAPKRWGIPRDSESGGIRLSLVIVDSHLLTGAPLKGGCRCPQLTYLKCKPLSNDRRWWMSTNCQAAVGSATL